MSFSRSASPRRPLLATTTARQSSTRSGYGSRAPSRPRISRASSRASLAYLPQGGEALILEDGPIGEEATELLQELVNPGRVLVEDDAEETGVTADDAASAEYRKSLPWYRRPSPWWLVSLLSITLFEVDGMLCY